MSAPRCTCGREAAPCPPYWWCYGCQRSLICRSRPPEGTVWEFTPTIYCREYMGHAGECCDGPAHWVANTTRSTVHGVEHRIARPRYEPSGRQR